MGTKSRKSTPGVRREETKMTPTFVVFEPGIMEVALTEKWFKGELRKRLRFAKICFIHVEFEGTK